MPLAEGSVRPVKFADYLTCRTLREQAGVHCSSTSAICEASTALLPHVLGLAGDPAPDLQLAQQPPQHLCHLLYGALRCTTGPAHDVCMLTQGGILHRARAMPGPVHLTPWRRAANEKCFTPRCTWLLALVVQRADQQPVERHLVGVGTCRQVVGSSISPQGCLCLCLAVQLVPGRRAQHRLQRAGAPVAQKFMLTQVCIADDQLHCAGCQEVIRDCHSWRPCQYIDKELLTCRLL
jgi:hypothetical protein